MLSIKQKLHEKRGASMVLAMIFLLFCSFIGGSVLAAATANGSRIEHQNQKQQAYYSQRSAMSLMADMLTDEDGNGLQLIITEMMVEKQGEPTIHTITFTSPSITALEDNALSATCLQKLLFETVVNNYPRNGATPDYSYFDWISSTAYSYAPESGEILINDGLAAEEELLTAYYSIGTNNDYHVKIDFGPDSYTILSMDCTIGRGKPTVVTVGGTNTTTTTTIIRWSVPTIQKGGV